jgi:hypothetical protein
VSIFRKLAARIEFERTTRLRAGLGHQVTQDDLKELALSPDHRERVAQFINDGFPHPLTAKQIEIGIDLTAEA